jgi:HAD superfamily hydrolase (TIGR01549 family)
MTIRAVFYDLDGTLRVGRPAGRHFFADYAAELGLPVTPEIRRKEGLWEHCYWAESSDLHADVRDFPDEKSFWANYNYRQLLALGALPEQINSLLPRLNVYMEESYRPADVLLDGLLETLLRLRESGLILGVISNRRRPFGEYLQELGINDYFDFSLAAGEVNSWKPDKEIFLHALRLTGIAAQEAMYVGDNYYADVLGARNAGLNPVLIDPEGLFEMPDCPVIQAHGQIISLIERRNLWPGKEK